MSEDDMQDIDISSPGGRGKNSNPFMHSGGVDGPAAGGGDSVYVDLDSEGVQLASHMLRPAYGDNDTGFDDEDNGMEMKSFQEDLSMHVASSLLSGALSESSSSSSQANPRRRGGARCVPKCCTIAHYRPHFDVSTSTIVDRLNRALFLPFFWKKPFYMPLPVEQPDLYTPIWLCSTLALVMAVTGNVSNYYSFEPSVMEPVWHPDFAEVLFAATVFYSMITVAPILVWIAIKCWVGGDFTLVLLTSLYGYSLVFYIPTASTAFLVRNLSPSLLGMDSSLAKGDLSRGDLSSEQKRKGIVLVCFVCLLQLAAGLVTKLYFFY